MLTFSRSWDTPPPTSLGRCKHSRCQMPPPRLCGFYLALPQGEVSPGGDSAPEDTGPYLGMTVFVKTGGLLVLSLWWPGMLLHTPQSQGMDSNVSSAKGGTPAL